MKVFSTLPGSRQITSAIFVSLFLTSSWSQEPSKYEPISEYKKIVLEDGSTYFGQLENGLASGLGTQTDVNGEQKTGYFQDGIFLGEYIVNPPWHFVDIYFVLKNWILKFAESMQLLFHPYPLPIIQSPISHLVASQISIVQMRHW